MKGNQFYKAFKLKEYEKSIIFQAKSVKDGEEWISHIEYLRTKANLDNFVTHYGSFKIPLAAGGEIQS